MKNIGKQADIGDFGKGKAGAGAYVDVGGDATVDDGVVAVPSTCRRRRAGNARLGAQYGLLNSMAFAI